MDEPRNINREEQQCISDCIVEFWGEDSPWKDDSERDFRYEQCLTDCRVCG